MSNEKRDLLASLVFPTLAIFIIVITFLMSMNCKKEEHSGTVVEVGYLLLHGGGVNRYVIVDIGDGKKIKAYGDVLNIGDKTTTVTDSCMKD